jgi:hypothetical protein
MGGNFVSGSFASYVIRLGRIVFGMGRLDRFLNSVALGAPGVPVPCWPMAVAAKAAVKVTLMVLLKVLRFITFLLVGQ